MLKIDFVADFWAYFWRFLLPALDRPRLPRKPFNQPPQPFFRTLDFIAVSLIVFIFLDNWCSHVQFQNLKIL